MIYLLTCSANISAQLLYSGQYFKCLENNLHSLYSDDQILKSYCESDENNNRVIELENEIKIGNEDYLINDIILDYYKGFSLLNNKSECRLKYAWAELRAEIFLVIENRNVVKELAYLPVVISSFEKYYKSAIGGYGYWGLSYIPAVRYGIVADSCYDERLDLSKSSVAAISYLNQLHESFGSWDYAITAYVCGPAIVRKAMSNTNDFDSVLFYIDSPNKYTFYAFLACTKWMKENEIEKPKVENSKESLSVDTVFVNQRIHFEQIAGVLNIDLVELLELNPLFTGKVIDGRYNHKTFYLPSGNKEKYNVYKDSICFYKDSIYFPKYKVEIIEEPVYSYRSNSNYVSVSPGDDYEEIKYSVVTGDNLGFIAEKHNVKVSEIQEWNNIRGTTIYVGQLISIWVKKGTASNYIKKVEPEKKKESFTDIVKLPEPQKTAFDPKNYTLVETYVVKSGDSPYKIALAYSWATAEDIMLWNNISDPSKLQVGQKLKIYKKK